MPSADSYLQVIDSWRVLLLTLTSYFQNDWQVTIADDSKLGTGAEYFAVISAGAFPAPVMFSPVDAYYDWQVYTDLYARYKTEADTTDRLLKLRGDVTALVRANRDSLGDTPGVTDTTIQSADLMQYVMSKGLPDAGPVFKMQKMLITVRQYVDVPVS